MGSPEAGPSSSGSHGSIRITPLSGSQTANRALCHLLEFDDAKILLDCGINERREEFGYNDLTQERTEYLDKLKELAPQLTLVLLSAPTVEALGLLPFLVSKLRLACPIYATFPCRTLGQLTLEQWVQARSNEEAQEETKPKKSQTSEDVERKASVSPAPVAKVHKRADDVAWRVTKEEIILSFSRITPVVYSQVIRLSGRSNSPFSLLAHPAGTYLGATLWSLRSATTDSLLYAPAFNHVNERTLDMAAFMVKGKDGRNEVNEAMRRVGILVIGAERSRITATKAKERDKAFLDLITSTLQANGTIFLPVDTAGRFIELIVLLEQHWSFSNLSSRFPLILVSPNGEDIIFTIRRLADSLGGHLGGNEAERERVLKFRNVRLVDSPEQLNARYPADQPKLVLAAPASLVCGYARQIIVSNFLSSSRSLVLLTSPGPSGSLASHLFELWNERQGASTQYGSGKVGEVIDFDAGLPGQIIKSATNIHLKMRKKVLLQGEELMSYLEEERAAREKEQKAKALAERNRRMMEADDANESSDSDSDESDDEREDARAIASGEAGEGTGIGAPSYAEPGSGPAMRSGKLGVSKQADASVTATGGGAWDEFFDDPRGTNIGGFDIYVRQAGGGANASSIANMSSQTKYKMFPFFERRRKVDGYGETIDIEGWKTRNKAPEEVEAALADSEAVLGKRKREEETEAAAPQEPPHKFITEDITVQVRCKVAAFDFEGKADGRALRSILPLIEPKKLVLVNGDIEATEDLASALQSASLTSDSIFMPSVGETVKIADVTKSFSVRLDDDFMTALALRKIDEYEVVPVKGILGQSDESTVPVLIPSATVGGETRFEGETGDIDTEMEQSDSLPALSAPHFIGDIKLAMLKNKLAGRNVPVSFSKGTLVCGPVKIGPAAGAKAKDPKISRLAKLTGAAKGSPTPELEDDSMEVSGGKVLVRKEAGQLVLEGQPGETFYAVRAAVYELHAAAA